MYVYVDKIITVQHFYINLAECLTYTLACQLPNQMYWMSNQIM